MTRPDPDATERSLRMFVAERDEVIAAQRERLAELERQLAEQYMLVARYRRVLAPALWLRDRARNVATAPRRTARRAYEAIRRVAWRHSRLAKPAVWLKRRLRPGPTSPAEHDDDARALFHPEWYAARYPDVAGPEPWASYRESGWRAGRNPNPLFDTRWYLAAHPEAAGADPLEHYVREGWRAGADPGPLFSVAWYLEQHPDVAAAGLEPLRHYLERGMAEGRFTSPAHAESCLTATAAGAPAAPTSEDGYRADLDLLSGSAPVVFDADTLILGRHGLGAAARAAARMTRISASNDTARLGASDSTARLAASDGTAHLGASDGAWEEHYRRAWTDVRPDVSGTLHRLAAAGAGVGVRSSHPAADAALLEELGFDLDGVPVARDDPPPGAVHVRLGGRRGADAPGVIEVPPPPEPDQTFHGLRRRLAAAATLHAAARGIVHPVRRRALRAAFETALLPTALVAAAVEEAYATGLDRVHYLSREGQFLARVHERVAGRLVAGAPPAAVTLEVSRRSTFGPSLGTFDADALMDLWRMYSRQSVGALLTSLGDQPSRYEREAAAYGIDLDAVVDGIHLDESVARFLADPVVARRLAEHNGRRRDALLAYLRSRTDIEESRWLVVDVGWRGTIQDNLARLLPDVQLDGIYLVLFPFLNPQLANTSKRAAGPDANEGDEYGFMEPPAAVERPWTADVPSVVDYRVDESGQAVAVLEKEHLGSVQSGLLALFQEATLAAAEIVADWLVAGGRTAADVRDHVRALVREYYQDPWPGVADLWFGSAHDDTFGVLNVTPFGKDRPGIDWLAGQPIEERITAAAEASMWGPGYRRWLPVQAAVALDAAVRTGRWPEGKVRLGAAGER